MKVVLYTHHALFEPALSTVDALSSSIEVHLVLEVPAGVWQTASFEAAPDQLQFGLIAADEVLKPFYPDRVRAMWRKAASFHLVSFGPRQSRPRSMLLTLRVLRWIRRLDADVLHVDDVDVSPRLAIALAISSARCPTLVGCHDPDLHSGERHVFRKHLARRLAFAKAAALLVHHETGGAALRRRHPRYPGMVHTVRLGTYTFLRYLGSEPSATPSPGPNVLLFGRITPYKGIETLFRVAPLVARAVPGVQFVVAGKPVPGYQLPPTPRLDNGGSVDTRYGYVPNTRIAELFDAATVVVCPYTDASQSGVVLTAYAFGCPVVATDVGGLPEYVSGTTGIVVPNGDDEALAAAIIRCLTDGELNESLRAGVRAVNVSDLSWQRVGAELAAVYASVAGTARQSRPRRPSGRPRRPLGSRRWRSPQRVTTIK